MIIELSISKNNAKIIVSIAGVAQSIANIYCYFYVEGGIAQWVALLNGVWAPYLAYLWVEKGIELGAAKNYLYAIIEGDIKITRNGRTFKAVYKDGTVHEHEVPSIGE